jgi:hypothetical protein
MQNNHAIFIKKRVKIYNTVHYTFEILFFKMNRKAFPLKREIRGEKLKEYFCLKVGLLIFRTLIIMTIQN